MVRKCFLCQKACDTQQKISLHQFPKPSSNRVLFMRWLHVLNLNERDDVRTLRICSNHFTPLDYRDPTNAGKYLMPLAVPSVGVPKHLPVPQFQKNVMDNGEAMQMSPTNSPEITSDELPAPATDTRSDENSPSAVTLHKLNGANQTAGRLWEQPRFISVILPSDVSTPRRAGRTIHFIKGPDKDKSFKCLRLQQANRCLQSQNLSLHHALANMQDKVAELTKCAVPVPTPEVEGDTQYNMESLRKDIPRSKIPKYWAYSLPEGKVLLFYFGSRVGPSDDENHDVTRSISVRNDLTVEVRARGKVCSGDLGIGAIGSMKDLTAAMEKISKLNVCSGLIDGSCCGNGLLALRRPGKCISCIKSRKRQVDKAGKTLKRVNSRRIVLQRERNTLKRKIKTLQFKLDQCEEETAVLKERCANVDNTALEDAIKKFPREQQEAIKACMNAAKCKRPTSRRYTNDWILECVLLRIKSRKAYLHIMNHNILPLPTLKTLNTYMEKMEPSYGFSMETLTMLRAKALKMEPWQLRGAISVDEMKLSEVVGFDSKKLLFQGFVDLGEHTPDGQENERGDHALVFLFQPFVGKWVQTVGAFFSKGCANSKVLHKLILEVVILLENCGLRVDVITTDGASWNRSMWRLFGLTGDDNSCEHPCAGGTHRRLWFCSDFYHLVKNFRNFYVAADKTWTPHGVIKKRHYVAILECDEKGGLYGLKAAHKLSRDALNPKLYKKMNVGLALQLFRVEVAAAMTLYREMHPDLSDCQPTIDFIDMFADVIAAMTSRCHKNALSVESQPFKVITDFIEYLRDWQIQVEEQDCKFMSSSTFHGFIVTLKTALELCTFLTEDCEDCDFKYLMTARLNQDALEGFLGLVHGCCGSHDHPDPILFIQVYQILSFYSLVKPPKGSNVEEVEIFETLLNMEDTNKNENKSEWEDLLDLIILKGSNSSEVHREHDYNVRQVNEVVQAYFAGFVARRMRSWTQCTACLSTLTKEGGDLPRDALIKEVSKGYLLYPSDELYCLLCACERSVLKTVGIGQINAFTFLRIADNLLAESTQFVGCSEHQSELTKKVINYYMVSRSKILATTYSKVHDGKRLREQTLRKETKL